jgi:5-methylcytosine-specific restriction endonuclease McrA
VQCGSALVSEPAPRAKVTPLAPQRFRVEVTLDGEAHDDLVQAQALLGREVAKGDVAEVLKRALHEYVLRLRRRRCAATDRPRPCSRRRSSDPRQVPAAVRRAVWERDGSQCTFVSESGHRCEERSGLELDHVIPVARGGEATESNLRLRCRPHNQCAADLAYGRGFMDEKRREAQAQAAQKREAAQAQKADQARKASATAETAAKLTVPLQILKFCPEEIRWVVAQCEALTDATQEELLRYALKLLGSRKGLRIASGVHAPV